MVSNVHLESFTSFTSLFSCNSELNARYVSSELIGVIYG